jgi:hypothetical protein
MTYLFYFLKFLAFVPQIAASVESLHAEKPVETKTQIASDALNLATGIATSVLPASEASIAQVAGQAAQSVLATTVQAVHTIQNPPAALPVSA